jgi:hypothetical protein
MSLLTNIQIVKILEEVKKVTDTFYTADVKYYLATDKLDKFNEDRDNTSYTVYNLKAYADYNNFGTVYKIQRSTDGAIDLSSVKLSFNYKDLIAAKLHDGNNGVIMNAVKDFFYLNGKKYKVISIYYDGLLSGENVLVEVVGELTENKT